MGDLDAERKGLAMTRSCCPGCRLRFSQATAASLRVCPFCAEPIQQLPASAVMGLKLVAIDALPDDPGAIALSAALPPPSPGRYPPAP